MAVPAVRIRACNSAVVDTAGEYVLYWMVAQRRVRSNFALERAVEHAVRLERPLVILEALRTDYPWASDRLHRFVVDGMAGHARELVGRPVTYLPYVEPAVGASRGLLETLAARSCVVVTDEFPAFFLPRMVAAAAARLTVLLEAVDSNGLLPLRATDSAFPTALAFRRYLQRALPSHLRELPADDPLATATLPRLTRLTELIERRWPPSTVSELGDPASLLAALRIDHTVAPVEGAPGGEEAATRALERFVGDRLEHYPWARNEPDADGGSGLSPYLHFGHISAHQAFGAVARREGWTVDGLTAKANGKRRGWWGMAEAAEAFLDQLVTWRELGFNLCCLRDDYDRYESLPVWARDTLARHEGDPRPQVYSVERLARADTHDRLWNAAQRQLQRDGTIHNYLRMLWGKKILEWSRSPREALAAMIELNNRFALDGRDPNSYAGIFWCLGRYDRPWGPERPIFGTVRYMSSENTARKFSLAAYLERFGR
jgi:deoxyribodipyrimidine photo-lyase